MLEILPNQIKIGWKTYDVEYAGAKLNSGNELYGQINYDTGVITIREYSTPDQMRATLIHEVLHAISEMYGMGLEEKLVTDLANSLYTVYKDNKDANDKKVEIVSSENTNSGEKHQSPYENDTDGGIEWLFNSNPHTVDKRIKIRVVDQHRENSIQSCDSDNAVIFIFNRDRSDLDMYDYAEDPRERNWMLAKIKDYIGRLLEKVQRE